MRVVKKICINCPAGCHLEIIDDNNTVKVSGNRCQCGVKYAENELRNPCRVVTAAILADSEPRCCIPVKSSAPVPVKLIRTLLDDLSKTRIRLPVAVGDKIIRNFHGTDIDIIATGGHE